MDLNRISVFVRVVEAGTFTAAAAALGVRKSSVSRSVAALEASLGIRLLQRTTRKLSLTDAGRAYYERARDALAGLEEAEQAILALGAAPRGLVRVTAPVDLASDLAPVVSAFLRAHPAVRVEMFLTARYVDLVKEGFDLAVRAGALTDSSLLARKVADTELGLFASPAYLDTAGRPRRLRAARRARVRPVSSRRIQRDLAADGPPRGGGGDGSRSRRQRRVRLRPCSASRRVRDRARTRAPFCSARRVGWSRARVAAVCAAVGAGSPRVAEPPVRARRGHALPRGARRRAPSHRQRAGSALIAPRERGTLAPAPPSLPT